MRASEAKQQTDLYFELLNRAKEARKRGDEIAALDCYRKSIPLLEALVHDTRREFGKFDISSIPAIETGAQLMAVFGDKAGLEELKAEILRTKALHSWIEEVDRAIEELTLSEQIVAVAADQPGVLQKDLHKHISAKQSQLGNLCHWLERAKRIRREKCGSSNAIYVATSTQPTVQSPRPPAPVRATSTRTNAKHASSSGGCGSLLLIVTSLLALISCLISSS